MIIFITFNMLVLFSFILFLFSIFK
jgi:hypothetical protein